MIKVILVDDHQMFIDGLKEIIDAMPNVEVAGEANNGVDLIDLLHKQTADVILMDVNMPKMDGLEATKKAIEIQPDIKILVLSMHDSSTQIQKLLKAGAAGYILKNTGKEELKTAIEKVTEGENYYSQEVSQRIMESFQKQKNVDSQYGEVKLSERETDVLKLIAQEYTTTEIGEKLFISHHTVESHRKNLLAKIGVKSVAGLVRYAVEKGILD